MRCNGLTISILQAGLVGKGKETHATAALEHQSRPLASLKDPDTFGPPPRNLAYHSSPTSPHISTPDRRVLGTPLTAQEIQATEEQDQREAQATEEAEQKAKAPPIPYRADTTGLSTSNLPKPPVRRLGYNSQASAAPTSPATKPKPALPPRLPPRQSPAPTQDALASHPAYSSISQGQLPAGYVNQGALKRLGSAGVSVPGFGIGGGSQDANPWLDQESSNTGSRDPRSPQTPQLSELQSRFSKLSTNSPSSPTQGTSFAQKQAALKTASSIRNDPSSISLDDAKATASTANNFRERHGDQVAAGWKSAGALNKKYDIANKVNGFGGNGAVSSQAETIPTSANTDTLGQASSLLKKRAPPPPPKKQIAETSSLSSPPPVPLYSKPKS